MFCKALLGALLCLLVQAKDQPLYFPDDTPVKAGFPMAPPPPSASQAQPPVTDLLLPSTPLNTTDLAAIRGTNQYETVVNNIISSGIFRTALSINRALLDSAQLRDSNIVFSPVSISAALALILLGSNGKTFDEVTSIMGLITGVVDIQKKSEIVHQEFGRMLRKMEQESGFAIGRQATFASAVFVQDNYPIRKVYKQTAEVIYQSEVLNLDFQRNPSHATRTINAWVSDRTRGKIKDIISEVSPETKVILVSALHFKAEWEQHFFRGVTKKRPFFVNGRNQPTNVEVEMMANGGDFPYFKDFNLGCEVLGLPYKGGKTTMYVVMPFNSTAQILKDFERKVTEKDLNRLADQTVIKGATVLFPKMKLESTIDLREALQKLGLKSLFNPSQANLALLSPGLSAGPIMNGNRKPVDQTLINPIAAAPDLDDVFIFSRFGEVKNCSSGDCVKAPAIGERNNLPQKLGQRVIERVETLDAIRNLINEQSRDNRFQNPGLYADQVIHKVFLEITERGTEGAAATGVSLARDGSKVGFRVDVPFLFFIRHEETKTVFFWGSVLEPTPSFSSV